MRLKLFLGLSCLLLSLNSPAAWVEENVVNGDFEAGFQGWTYESCWLLGPPRFPIARRNGQAVLEIGGDDLTGSFIEQRIVIARTPEAFGTFSSGDQPMVVAFDLGAIGNQGFTSSLRVTVLDDNDRVLVTKDYVNQNPTSQPGALIEMRTTTLAFIVRRHTGAVRLRFEDISPDGGVAVDPMLDNVRVFRFLPSSMETKKRRPLERRSGLKS